MLVCRIWKAIIEGTPLFWTHFEAIDGLKHVHNAVKRTGESLIDLILDCDDSLSADEFLAEVSGKVSRWGSVELSFKILPTSFGGLQTSACHSLEKLTLKMEDLLPSTLPLALFDRGPSPAVLKDLYLSNIPVDLAPMQLSNLSSLVLIDVHYIGMDDVLHVLRSSPALVTLQLEEIAIASLNIPDRAAELPILLESLKACQFQLSIPLIPMSSLAFGGLEIIIGSPGLRGYRYLRVILDSLMDYSGEEGRVLKAHLHLDGTDPTIEELQLFSGCSIVEQLTVSEKGSRLLRLFPMTAIEALGTRVRAGSQECLFPDLEVLEWSVSLDILYKLETAFNTRYLAVQPTQQAYADEHQHPRSLRELRFFPDNRIKLGSVDMEGLRWRLRILARGAKVCLRGAWADFGAPAS
ncbi:hypothetical protein FRC00_013553 [Tulasnella sp. 408]|nr:hypothetical protein FRC00_013553 [Tulasnella sp. 408]